EHIACPLAFIDILGINQIAVPAADRDAHDLETLALERLDLPPDEGMAYRGILIDQVGNPHARYLYSIRLPCRPSNRSNKNLTCPQLSANRDKRWNTASLSRSFKDPSLRSVCRKICNG